MVQLRARVQSENRLTGEHAQAEMGLRRTGPCRAEQRCLLRAQHCGVVSVQVQADVCGLLGLYARREVAHACAGIWVPPELKPVQVALTEDGLGFVYTPGGKLGTDSFTYTAIDAYGNTSLPATVSITIEKANSGVCYADMGGDRAHTAAVDLAEHGVFVGAKIGDSYFFEPERTLSRGEFVAMALAAMDVSEEDVQMTGFCDDASIPTWAKGYAVSALNAGVVSGVSTAEGVAFRANDAITLNEAAVVLNRLLRVTDVDLSDYDVQDADNAWCAQAVANLQSVSVIESGRFSTDEMRSGVTRAQAAEILSAAMTLKDGRAGKGGLLSGIFG